MTTKRMRTITTLAVSALIAAGTAVAASTPATASPAGYCGQGWNSEHPSDGLVTANSANLRTGPLTSCHINNVASYDDYLYVECVDYENGTWYFVDDEDLTTGYRGWILSSNFILTGSTPGKC